jgi:hypothetical protein
MSYTLDLPGFPTEVSPVIEMPDIAELLLMPMFNNINADDFYKYGTDFQRKLFDMTPFKGDMKYVSIKSHVQFVYPGVGTTGNKLDMGILNEWHIDFSRTKDHEKNPPETWHILASPATCLTEFNTAAGTYEIEDHKQTRLWLNTEGEAHHLVPKMIEPCRLYTFTNHAHRATNALVPEFRYFYRVQETFAVEPKPYEIARLFSSSSDQATPVLNATSQAYKWLPSLEHTPRGIAIHYDWSWAKGDED